MLKPNILLGLHSHIPLNYEKNWTNNELIENHLKFLNDLIEHLNNIGNTKINLHISGNLLKHMDKKYPSFSSTINHMLSSNQLELLSGGMYEPILPFIPREDRQNQIQLMNRFLNHTYGYTPSGAWLTELAWDPSIALDLVKSKIYYTCLSKKHFTNAGISENELEGYYITEEEGRKIAVFPILHNINELMHSLSPEEAVNKLFENKEKTSIVVFYRGLISDTKNLEWLKQFFNNLNLKSDYVEMSLFKDFFSKNKPNKRIYLNSLNEQDQNSILKPWKYYLLRYHEVNLIHKKMLRVSKKINLAKEGKSRFKVIKEMINQAQDLLYQGQINNSYWDNHLAGIYIPEERHATYEKLIRAENLIENASRKGARWIQISESDYDCDGNDEIIIETDTQNIYISPALGGAILEHDFKPKNLNVTNTISRRHEQYHSENPSSLDNGNIIYDNYTKLSLIEHFLDPDITLEALEKNKLNSLTTNVINSYIPEKIKAKEDNSKVTLCLHINLVKLSNNPEIELKKSISTRSGDSALYINYSITNKSKEKIRFVFGVEFNLNPTHTIDKDSFVYLNGDPNIKTSSPSLRQSEQINDINQLSIFCKKQELDLTLFWDKKAIVYRYPIETFSYNFNDLKRIYQGMTIIPTWNVNLDPDSIWELTITQNLNGRSYDH